MPSVEKLRRAFLTVIVLQFFGLVAAVLFASGLSNQLTLPFGIVFAVDYVFIILSAVLAELAAPSENAARITTSFVVATSTLAPLAVFVSKALENDPKEDNILKHLTLNWSPDILVIAVTVCTAVAIVAALALGRIANKNSKGSETEKSQPGLFERTLLSASILLFGSYTFLVNDWKSPKFESDIDKITLVLPTVGVIGLIISFCSVPWIIGPGVRAYPDAYSESGGGSDLLKKAFPSTGTATLALAVIAVLGGLLIQNRWIPLGFFDASADDLAHLLFLFAGIVIFLLFAILMLAAVAIWNRRATENESKRDSKKSRNGDRTSERRSILRWAVRRTQINTKTSTSELKKRRSRSTFDGHNVVQMLLWLFYAWALFTLAYSFAAYSGFIH